MNNIPRIIPVLSIIGEDLVKTCNFRKPRYLGDPINAVKIFNGKFVDELIICDIRATLDNTSINYELLKKITSQAFMPLGYGGGIKTIEEAKLLYKIGFEKLVFSSQLYENPDFIKQCVRYAGSQSVVASVDIKKKFNNYEVYIHSGQKKVSNDLSGYIESVINLGVGEIIVNSIDRDSMMKGYDLNLVKLVSELANIPVIALGGAGNTNDFKDAIKAGAHSVAAGSMFVYYGLNKAVLITYCINPFT